MTRTYEIECIWHTHSGYSINDKEMGMWKGIMFCEENGHCYGLIKDEVFGLQNLTFNHYFAGHFEASKGISFVKTAVGKDVSPDDYTLVKDSRDGFCGEVAEFHMEQENKLDLNVACGARFKAREIELTPAEFNCYQREIEKVRPFINNYIAVALLSGIEENSRFLMDSVMALAQDNVNYQNSKFML